MILKAQSTTRAEAYVSPLLEMTEVNTERGFCFSDVTHDGFGMGDDLDGFFN